MKSKIILLALALTASAGATETIAGNYGDLFTKTGAPVPNGTLYVLVASSTGTFPGGFTINNTLDATGALTFTQNQVLTLGATLGGATNTIFGIGGTNASVADGSVSGLALTGNVLVNKNYAVYWFPGSTFTNGDTTGTVGLQVGGYNNTVGVVGILDGMVIPADSADVAQGFQTVSAGGLTPNSSTVAFSTTAVPEPSAALLGAIGALGLLRRRRN